MARTESVGQENYRTHRFVEFRVASTHYDAAVVEATLTLKKCQEALKHVYVLHMTVKADLNRDKQKYKKKVGTENYLFLCQLFARAVRAENNRFKHLRQREIHELDTFATGLNTGWMLD